MIRDALKTSPARTPLRRAILSALVATTLGAATLGASALAGTTELISVDSSGEPANRDSTSAAISADGRFIAFTSTSTNLVEGISNSFQDVFVHDRLTGATQRVSISSNGEEANSSSGPVAISGDGRIVVFASLASNLVEDDNNGHEDVFVHDRESGQTWRVSIGNAGQEPNGRSSNPDISGDGRIVAFSSAATNLASGDTQFHNDVFVYDLTAQQLSLVSVDGDGLGLAGGGNLPALSWDGRYVAFVSYPGDIMVRDRMNGTTELASIGIDGESANAYTNRPSISADGSRVAFVSSASNLIANDMSATLSQDIFVRDLTQDSTIQISYGAEGEYANANSDFPRISADGNYVVFQSDASNLVEGDTNEKSDIFLHDLVTGTTGRISVGPDDEEADDHSLFPDINADGVHIAYTTWATNLTPHENLPLWKVVAYERAEDEVPPDLPMTLEEIAERIRTLVPGSLNRGQASALLAKIDAATRSLERGQSRPACEQLNALGHQLDAFGRSGQVDAGTTIELATGVISVTEEHGC